jgi:hypothetical protein
MEDTNVIQKGEKMNLKKLILVLCLLIASSSLFLSAYPDLTFARGDSFLTAQIGYNEWSVPFGLDYEHALSGNIGIGASVMLWFWQGASVTLPSVDIAFHFIQLDHLDLFAGVGAGYLIYNPGKGYSSSSDWYFYPFAAGRLWLSQNMGFSLRFNWGVVGDWTGGNAFLGLVFRI